MITIFLSGHSVSITVFHSFPLSQLCRSVFALQLYIGLHPHGWKANEEKTDGCPQAQVPPCFLRREGQEQSDLQRI